MCIGIPMQVIRCDGIAALCRSAEGDRTIDMSLVGHQPEDTWVLVFIDTAREVITAERAGQIQSALTALQNVMQGDTDQLDQLFADLTEQEPQLPEHLR